jgi:hypothetical protein
MDIKARRPKKKSINKKTSLSKFLERQRNDDNEDGNDGDHQDGGQR